MNAPTHDGSKKQGKTWITADGHDSGRQNTSIFLETFPTRLARRAFYARRRLFYQHVRLGLVRNRERELRRYCEGPQPAERRYFL